MAQTFSIAVRTRVMLGSGAEHKQGHTENAAMPMAESAS
jgi:hypothetical protein